MAFILHVDSAGHTDFLCSGTVASSNVVLTAGHCAFDKTAGAALDPSGFRVVTGAVDWTDTSHRQVSAVSKVIVHPSYDPTSAASDAALLVLSTPTTAPAIRLATSNDQNLEQGGTPAFIAGWGNTYAGQTTAEHVLQWASTVVQNAAYCAPYNSYYNSSIELCAVNSPSNDTGVCNGDSGGPLVASDASGKPVEIGVTSRGPADCNTSTPDYFTTVAPLSSWANSWISSVAPPPPPPPSTPPPSTSPVKPQLPFMTLAAARSFVKQTLAGLFGRAFRRGHAYTTSCSRSSGIRVSCAVKFRSGPNDYSGKVTVYYVNSSGGTVHWTDSYTLRWVNRRCSRSAHRRRCQIHTKRGSW
jgi:secreted trypsin-like serine protease